MGLDSVAEVAARKETPDDPREQLKPGGSRGSSRLAAVSVT